MDVVVVLMLVVEFVTLSDEPAAPIDVVLPGVPGVLGDSAPAVAGGVAGVVTALRSVVVDVVEEVVGVASRLVQAPRETAATSASAAHAVRDAFIRKLLEDG